MTTRVLITAIECTNDEQELKKVGHKWMQEEIHLCCYFLSTLPLDRQPDTSMYRTRRDFGVQLKETRQGNAARKRSFANFNMPTYNIRIGMFVLLTVGEARCKQSEYQLLTNN